MSDASTTDDRAGWELDMPGSTDSVPLALIVAGVLGALGPALAWGLSQGLGAVMDASGLGPLVAGLLALASVFAIPYLAFAGPALAALRWRGFDLGDVRAYFGIELPGIRDFLVLVGGWVLIIVLIFAAAAIVQAVGAEPAQNQTVEQAQEAPAVILLLIPVMFLVVGPTEEILYRGVVQGRLREVMGPIPAIAVASGIFAAAHLLALTGGLTARATTIALLFLPALVLGIVYEYTENLLVPIVLHGLHNSFLLAILYVVLAFGPEGQLEEATATLLPALPV